MGRKVMVCSCMYVNILFRKMSLIQFLGPNEKNTGSFYCFFLVGLIADSFQHKRWKGKKNKTSSQVPGNEYSFSKEQMRCGIFHVHFWRYKSWGLFDITCNAVRKTQASCSLSWCTRCQIAGGNHSKPRFNHCFLHHQQHNPLPD